MASSVLQQQPLNALETISISRKKGSKNDNRAPLIQDSEPKKGFSTDSSRLGLEKLLSLPHMGVYSATNNQPASKRRPGDVYNGPSSSRPLGLLPNKRKKDTWRQLGVFIPNETHRWRAEDTTVVGHTSTATILPPPNEPYSSSSFNNNKVVRFIEQRKYPLASAMREYSRPSPSSVPMIVEDDPEYLSTLAQCNLKEYNSSSQPRRDHQSLGYFRTDPRYTDQAMVYPNQDNNHYNTTGWRGGGNGLPGVGKQQTLANLSFQGNKRNLEYLSLLHPVHLNKRTLLTDCRNAKDYEPCERCALRGTRCRHCKAIRTGGGYIILDGLGDDDMLKGRDGSMRFNGQYDASGRYLKSALSSRRSNRSGGLSGDGSLPNFDESGRETGEDGFGFDDDDGRSGGRGRGRGGDLSPDGILSSRGRGGRGNTTGADGDSRMTHRFEDIDEMDEDSYGINGGLNKYGGRDQNSTRGRRNGGSLDDIDDLDDDGTGGGGRGGRNRSGGGANGSDGEGDMEDTDGSNLKRRSKRRAGDGSDDGDGGRDGKGKHGKGDLEKDHGKGSKDDHGSSRGRNSRGSRRGQDLNGDTDDYDSKSTHQVGFHLDEDKGPSSAGQSMYDLMRFKSKRDKVRAKSCTLRELKGIDPLDYLAKYCIIDQDKVPHYQRVFENVDRDEDDEISVLELDFALKAVNYNLISDAELQYVNKVLELTGRYALNFQLFTLVAALSEKVVALDGMVKRLVNTMDFEALETKMKKCKELFYLLANREEDEEDGIVTAAALGIELQAGGLTQEHVEYVIAHLDQEQRGKIEFLDYLVYVPLFVEIHGNINSNPLDFSRTK